MRIFILILLIMGMLHTSQVVAKTAATISCNVTGADTEHADGYYKLQIPLALGPREVSCGGTISSINVSAINPLDGDIKAVTSDNPEITITCSGNPRIEGYVYYTVTVTDEGFTCSGRN